MNRVQEIADAIAALPREEFWLLTDKVVEMREDSWSRQIEADSEKGHLDFLFAEADAEAKEGALRSWPGPENAI
jgi:hypothetical protein